MKKKIIAIFLAGGLVLSMCACGKEQAEPSSAATEEGGENAVSFADMENYEFTFSSGAGAWETSLRVKADGTFSGGYYDVDLGTMEENYPNGTMYLCSFDGRFTELVKVNDYTYSTRIQEINYEREPGTEEIIDEMRYCYTEANGLDGADDFLIYAPGAPLAELPEDFLSWVGYYDLSETEETELPFFGLYGLQMEAGFRSYDRGSDIVESVREMVAKQEETASALEASIENDELSQAELNEKTMQLYEEWDYALNSVWEALKQVLEEDAMNALTAEEREWIEKKEKIIAEAGAEVEGGTIQPMIMNMKGAGLTKARVYELLELLEKEGAR